MKQLMSLVVRHPAIKDAPPKHLPLPLPLVLPLVALLRQHGEPHLCLPLLQLSVTGPLECWGLVPFFMPHRRLCFCTGTVVLGAVPLATLCVLSKLTVFLRNQP